MKDKNIHEELYSNKLSGQMSSEPCFSILVTRPLLIKLEIALKGFCLPVEVGKYNKIQSQNKPRMNGIK